MDQQVEAEMSRQRIATEGEWVIDRAVRELEERLELPKAIITCLLLIRLRDEGKALEGEDKLELATLLHKATKDLCDSLEEDGYDFVTDQF